VGLEHRIGHLAQDAGGLESGFPAIVDHQGLQRRRGLGGGVIGVSGDRRDGRRSNADVRVLPLLFRAASVRTASTRTSMLSSLNARSTTVTASWRPHAAKTRKVRHRTVGSEWESIRRGTRWPLLFDSSSSRLLMTCRGSVLSRAWISSSRLVASERSIGEAASTSVDSRPSRNDCTYCRRIATVTASHTAMRPRVIHPAWIGGMTLKNTGISSRAAVPLPNRWMRTSMVALAFSRARDGTGRNRSLRVAWSRE
jgi:hypothetical protein